MQDSRVASCALCEVPISHDVPRLCVKCAKAVHTYVSIQMRRAEVRIELDRTPTTGSVYYIRRGELVKIGFTTDLRGRMSALLPDEVLAVEPGTYAVEAERHRQFEHLRHPGQREWFRQAQDLTDHMQRVVAEHGSPPELPTLTRRNIGRSPSKPPQEWPPGWVA